MKQNALRLSVLLAGIYLAGIPTYYTVATVGLTGHAATNARHVGLYLLAGWVAIAAFAGFQALASDLEILQMLRSQLRMLGRRQHLLVDARQRDTGTRAIELMLYGTAHAKAGLLRSLKPKVYVVDDPSEPTELVPLLIEDPPSYDRWRLNQGVVGLAFADNDPENPVVLTGDALAAATAALNPEQRSQFGDLQMVAAVVIRDANDRPIGVLSCSNQQATPHFGTSRREAMKLLATDLGILLRLVR